MLRQRMVRRTSIRIAYESWAVRFQSSAAAVLLGQSGTSELQEQLLALPVCIALRACCLLIFVVGEAARRSIPWHMLFLLLQKSPCKQRRLQFQNEYNNRHGFGNSFLFRGGCQCKACVRG